MTAYKYPRNPAIAYGPFSPVVQDASPAVQSGPADLSEPPRALSMVQDQINFVTIEITEIISQPETRALPAPIDSQESQGHPWEYGVTPPPRATVLSVVVTFLSLCLYLAIHVYLPHA
ncbi:hypothetical protein EDD21DRAFT_350528 [Dissophora ornata]|nr:hypothetical protein EDD21DRAFT_350528 [Dissophora ornata]